MIHPKTNIQILDIAQTGDGSSSIPIEKLFRYYYHNSRMTEDGTRYISFISPINITEQFNWTRIIQLNQVKGPFQWKLAKVENTYLYMNKHTLIPVYDIEEAWSGFHGEVKYPYKIKTIQDLQEGDNIRLRRGKDVKGEEIEFGTHIDIGEEEVTTDYAYSLETASGFFTGNNIHLISINKR